MSKYEMTLSLNVLNHLGINLYSNIPAVISETVANSWDADAQNVDIKIYASSRKISISDDGQGMDVEDINRKYLTVGYQKRENNEATTSLFQRPVMGRKGIGKLSLFSIARKINIYTIKKGKRNSFQLDLKEIQSEIASSSGKYYPKELDNFPDDLVSGTRIVLSDLKKNLNQTVPALKKRLARRFSIIGTTGNFAVNINSEPISIEDREYFHKIQFLWSYNDEDSFYASKCKNLIEAPELRPSLIPESNYEIRGWIGAARESGDLKDGFENINKIVVMVRGKMAQEDILDEFNEGGIYASYLIGEIHADFLDEDGQADIATSSRQRIIEDDPRYEALKNFIQAELKNIQNRWTNLRDTEGTKRALEIPVIKEWFGTLGSDSKKRARSLFGKINRITTDNPTERRTLLKHGILAFESLRYKDNLDALDNLDGENLVEFARIFENLDDIEASLYHQIVNERLKVIDTLRSKVEEDDLEKLIQAHLYDHLWLLDPSWERATETEYMEQQVATEFDKITAKLNEDERRGRVDIKYKSPYGKHVIIELKKAVRVVETEDLTRQIKKYRSALKKILRSQDKGNEEIEIICILGKPPKDWKEEDGMDISKNTMKSVNGSIRMYQELIEGAYNSYKGYLEKRDELGRITNILNELDFS